MKQLSFLFTLFAAMPRLSHGLELVLTRLAAVSTIYTHEDVDRCQQIGFAIYEDERQQARELLETYPGMPCALNYSSDSTSFLVRAQADAVGTEGQSIHRRGGLLQEFIMQRGYIKIITPAGEIEMVPILAPPRPENHGKAATNAYTAANDFWPIMPGVDEERICHFHLCMDRALLNATARWLRRREAWHFDPDSGVHRHLPVDYLRLFSWFSMAGCALHDAQNAFKRGLDCLSLERVVDDLYIAVESLRNSFAHLHGNLYTCLRKRVSFDRTGFRNKDEAKLWRFLGVAAIWISDFVFAAPWGDREVLHVREEVGRLLDPYDVISSIWMYAMRWKKFSESRWMTLGSSARNVLRSIVLGVDGLMRDTRENDKVEYKAHGWDRCTRDVRTYMATASFGAYPIEAFCIELLHDDRLARNYDEVCTEIRDELDYLEEMPLTVWQRVAECITGMTGQRLRNYTLHTAHSSVAFLRERALDVVGGLPWSLGRGT